jgi:hypothetical protein
VVANFDKLRDLPAINRSLQRAKLEPIAVPKEERWLQEHANRGEAGESQCHAGDRLAGFAGQAEPVVSW